jgi:hypothetical protein
VRAGSHSARGFRSPHQPFVLSHNAQRVRRRRQGVRSGSDPGRAGGPGLEQLLLGTPRFQWLDMDTFGHCGDVMRTSTLRTFSPWQAIRAVKKNSQTTCSRITRYLYLRHSERTEAKCLYFARPKTSAARANLCPWTARNAAARATPINFWTKPCAGATAARGLRDGRRKATDYHHCHDC